MELTTKQAEGLKIAVQRFKDHQPWTCIAGYAGTGKSTLVKFIVDALGIDKNYVCYIAYTGKAAKVLKDKGCPNAMTAHRLLYTSYPKNDGTFYHKIKRPLDFPYKLIVVDEISMLPKHIWELLLSHHIPVICLGDPFQLPPIGEDNEVLQNPHIFLDEIMRQEEDNEIIRLTMDIRNGKSLPLYKGNDVMIVRAGDMDPGMYLWADQIIVGKNDTRRSINSQMRQVLFDVKDEKPIEGDKVICLRNSWETINEVGDVLVNGLSGTISNINYNNYNPFLKPMMLADFIPDDYDELDEEFSFGDLYFRQLNIDYKLLTTGEPTVNEKNFKRFPKGVKPLTFDYGYCITCHKSQGSEYDKVLVFEEHLKDSQHARWLYTAATRAKKKLIIVKDRT